MSRVRILITLLSILFLVQNLQGQIPEGENLVNMMNQIRKEKFDYILPHVLRDNNIDMWIHVMRAGRPDPLGSALGSSSGVFIFTDRDGDRIERAVLGQSDESLPGTGAYDIFFSEEIEVEGDAGWENIIREFVAERDPRRIAVNFSKRNAVADGISHTDYVRLVEAIGDTYAEKIISADNVIADFLSGKVIGEIVLDGYFGLRVAEILDREFARIVPGETLLKDISGNVFVRDLDGNEHNNDDYVLQKGDLFTILHGAGAGIFVADLGGNAYILREGETELPRRIIKIWDEAMVVREILRKNIKMGTTAGKTLDLLIRKVEEAGYYYNPVDRYDIKADPDKTQVHFDLHAQQGTRSMDAPRISPLGPDWEREMKIPLFHSFTFEYMIHMPVPEEGRGKHLYIAFHDGAIVTERGVEFPYPPDQGIRIIR